jgi:LmbE family N-acetylglucosaminyl deacetylase
MPATRGPSGQPQPLERVRLRPEDRLLLVAAHPDDDTLAAGGLLQRAVAASTALRVVFATDGENNPWAQRASERRLLVLPPDRARFGARRRREATAALARLGGSPEQAVFLGLPDQGLTPLLLADAGRVAVTLRELVVRERPTLLLAPSAADLHPDHSALAVLLRLAIGALPAAARPRELAYVVHNPALRRTDAFPISHELSEAERSAKLAAIHCHASQLHLRGPWLRSFAARTESFQPAPANAPHPCAGAHPTAAGTFAVPLATHPRLRAFGARTLLVLADRPGERPLALACPLPAFPRRLTVRDAASGTPLGEARYVGHALGGTLSLPGGLLAGATRVFVKLERRFGFFDEAGWLELPLPA